jgi:hypothetical protein
MTNHLLDGIHLEPDDRRHFVAWSQAKPAESGYWNGLWDWYRDGGIEHAAKYLATLDVSGFDPNKPPPKTAAWRQIVAAGQSPESGELADVLAWISTARIPPNARVA